MACTCKNIIPQSKECYEQQIVVKVPDYLDIRMNAPGRERKEYVALDPCITAEVIQLWILGIVTTGACCGHNLPDGFPFIGVKDEFIPKMKELGYEVAHNKCRPNDEDSFVPKSVGGKTATKELAALPIQRVSNNKERVAVICGTCKWQYAKYEYKCEACCAGDDMYEQDTDC